MKLVMNQIWNDDAEIRMAVEDGGSVCDQRIVELAAPAGKGRPRAPRTSNEIHNNRLSSECLKLLKQLYKQSGSFLVSEKTKQYNKIRTRP